MRTWSDLDFSLIQDKMCWSSTVMEYIGIVLDTYLMKACISQEHMQVVIIKLDCCGANRRWPYLASYISYPK